MSSFIKNVCAGESASATASSVAVTVGSAVSAHQGSILVAVGYGNTAATSVSSVVDSKSNSYAHDFTSAGNASNEVIEFWRCADPANALTTSDTITATCNNAATKAVCLIADLYVKLGSPDVTNSNFVTPANLTNAISVTPVAADIIAIACCAYNDQETSIGLTTFTKAAQFLPGSTGFISQATAFLDSPGTGSVTATFTAATVAHTSVSIVATYPAAPTIPFTPARLIVQQAVNRAASY